MEAVTPEISVIIPVYNHPAWLKEALKSVFNQSYQDYEIIVVDDGSTDDIESLEILNDRRIRYFRNKNHGVAYSRNFGIKKAKGTYIAFLDSDDIWLKDKLKIQIREMKKNNAIWSQHCFLIFRDESECVESKVNTYVYRGNEKRCMFLSFKVQTSCFMVKRDAIVNNSIKFDETKTFGEERLFYRGLSQRYPLLFIDKYLLKYRNHGNNFGKIPRVQLASRADCWKELNRSRFFKKYTTFYVKIAYAYCAFWWNIVKKHTSISSTFISAIYAPAWFVFKVETFRITK